MTYAETAGELRASMTWLLGRYRILYRLGDPDEQARLGGVIQRHRDVTTGWCFQAVSAATPKTDLTRTTSRTRDPAEELRYRLGVAVVTARSDEPLMDLLATSHGNELVDAWQRAARAAAIGEREVAAVLGWGRLPTEQSRTVLKDASDITRALVLLDTRYRNIPGWQTYKESSRLGHAAEACSVFAGEQTLDYSVDERGWRPTAGIIEGPALPGVAGAVQAQHNTVVDLARFPNALNLRRILLSQAKLSQEASRHAEQAEPRLAESFRDRAALYGELVRSSRDIGGLIGAGGYAAVESHNAATRLQRAPVDGHAAPESLNQLARLCTRADSRLAATIDHGFQEKLYFVSVQLPRLVDHQSQGIHRVRQRWVPVTSPLQAPLLVLAHDRLRPAPVPQPAPESRESRAAYEALLVQQNARLTHGEPRR